MGFGGFVGVFIVISGESGAIFCVLGRQLCCFAIVRCFVIGVMKRQENMNGLQAVAPETKAPSWLASVLQLHLRRVLEPLLASSFPEWSDPTRMHPQLLQSAMTLRRRNLPHSAPSLALLSGPIVTKTQY